MLILPGILMSPTIFASRSPVRGPLVVVRPLVVYCLGFRVSFVDANIDPHNILTVAQMNTAPEKGTFADFFPIIFWPL